MAVPFLLLWVNPGVGSTGGAGRRRYHRPSDLERELERERPFSRKRFEELRAAEIAQAEAQRAAEELKASKRKRAIEAAAQEAAKALRAAATEQADEAREAAELLAMTNALEAAVGARTTKEAIEQANLAKRAAIALMTMFADLEDEEAAVMLLLN